MVLQVWNYVLPLIFLQAKLEKLGASVEVDLLLKGFMVCSYNVLPT